MENKPDTRIAKEKLMILYIIKKSNSTLSFNQLTNLILEFDLLNYFTFMQYFSELSDSSFLEKWAKPNIKLTDFAIQVLELLENTIDESVKRKIDDIFSEKTKLDFSENSRLTPSDFGKYVVTLSSNKKGDRDFMISFTADSLEIAKKIENAWKKDNENFYKKLMKAVNDASDI